MDDIVKKVASINPGAQIFLSDVKVKNIDAINEHCYDLTYTKKSTYAQLTNDEEIINSFNLVIQKEFNDPSITLRDVVSQSQVQQKKIDQGIDWTHTATRSNLDVTKNFDNYAVAPFNSDVFNFAKKYVENFDNEFFKKLLFIQGKTGIGKSHVINAIGNYLIQNNKRVFYTNSTEFRDDYISTAAKYKRSSGEVELFSQFTKKYTDVDLLIFDDFQKLTGQETRNNFFSIFERLKLQKKNLIIVSDIPIEQLDIEPRIYSRFMESNRPKFKPLDYRSKVILLKQMYSNQSNSIRGLAKNSKDLTIADEIFEYYAKISELSNANIRGLQGILNEIMSQCFILGNFVAHDDNEIKLSDIVSQEEIDAANNVKVENTPTISRPPMSNIENKNENFVTSQSIIDVVSLVMGVKASDILATGRKKNVTIARQLCYYFHREILNLTLTQIATKFNKKSHTTITKALTKVSLEIETDPSLREYAQEIQKKIENY